jgi:hypothetical protein
MPGNGLPDTQGFPDIVIKRKYKRAGDNKITSSKY